MVTSLLTSLPTAPVENLSGSWLDAGGHGRTSTPHNTTAIVNLGSSRRSALPHHHPSPCPGGTASLVQLHRMPSPELYCAHAGKQGLSIHHHHLVPKHGQSPRHTEMGCPGTSHHCSALHTAPSDAVSWLTTPPHRNFTWCFLSSLA